MKTYSDFVDRVFLQEKLLEKLVPGDPQDYALVRRIEAAEDKLIAGDRPIKNAEMFALVRGGLLYAADAIHEAHTIFQEAKGDLGSYWHGMMHRRRAISTTRATGSGGPGCCRSSGHAPCRQSDLSRHGPAIELGPVSFHR